MGQDVRSGCVAESGASWTQSPGPSASAVGKMAECMKKAPRKGMAALGAETLNDVEPPYAGIIQGVSRALLLLCILRRPMGLAWVVYASSTPMLVTMAQEHGPPGAGVWTIDKL